ncbi:MAG: YibE/F family protein [Peptococcaceae bacterium]|nr:YibE/F family protein [Peptococcaceae bacterium]
MNVAWLLLVILFGLMLVIGGVRGLKSFLTLFTNFITLFVMLILISFKLDPIKVTVFGSIIISSVTLFFINGFNKKTIAALLSVTLVVGLTLLLAVSTASNAHIQGFGQEQAESIAYLIPQAQLDFNKIVICEILLGLLGAIIDVAISIASAMQEIHRNNLQLSKNSLMHSGINIGKDILGTMTNTLLFAFIGGFMTLLIWFSKLHYTLADIVNAKVFGAEVVQILCSGIGIILIIPVTAYLASRILWQKELE